MKPVQFEIQFSIETEKTCGEVYDILCEKLPSFANLQDTLDINEGEIIAIIAIYPENGDIQEQIEKLSKISI